MTSLVTNAFNFSLKQFYDLSISNYVSITPTSQEVTAAIYYLVSINHNLNFINSHCINYFLNLSLIFTQNLSTILCISS